MFSRLVWLCVCVCAWVCPFSFMSCSSAELVCCDEVVEIVCLALAVVVGAADHFAVVHVRSLLATTLAVHLAHLVAALQRITAGGRLRFVTMALCVWIIDRYSLD